MKHLLNFLPSEKYRAKRSFLFRLIVSLLYIVPLLKASILVYEYYEIETVKLRLEAFSGLLEKKEHEFLQKNPAISSNAMFSAKNGGVASLNLQRNEERLANTAPEILSNFEKSVFERAKIFFREINSGNFSWGIFFSDLENVLPVDTSISRISVKPESDFSVSVEGKAKSVELITSLLRKLYQNKRFHESKLLRHAIFSSDSKEELWSFYFETRYFPEMK
ncbi:MAG: hypothetical protein HQM08_26245 [Candidatus Riflebacteria bacterium]|nr:hypothetical protein [Candidatus Riflebacteria bacterium]